MAGAASAAPPHSSSPARAHEVAVTDFVTETAAETVALINAAGGQAMSVTADATDAAQVAAMINRGYTYGRLDCAFNNAGIAGFMSMPPARKRMNGPRPRSTAWSPSTSRASGCAWPSCRRVVAQGGGTIVNTGSIAGLAGLPTSSAYVALHGVIGLTKTAALEYAGDNIRVNAVRPGYIRTSMTEDTMRRRGEELMAPVPFHRMGTPEEIAEMVAWLCSDRASYVTGAAYNVDGGYMAT